MTSFRSIIYRVILLFVVALIVFNLFRRVSGVGNLNFNGMFSSISDISASRITFNIQDFQIGGNWGIIDGLRNFINAFATLLGVLIWLAVSLLNLLLFLFSFVRLLFV